MATSTLASVVLSPADLATLGPQHPTLGATTRGSARTALAIVGSADLVGAVGVAVRSLAADAARAARVVEALSPDVRDAVLHGAPRTQLRLQAEARAGVRATVDLLSSSMVGRQAGTQARRASAIARQ